MAPSPWPPFDLVLRTRRLELRIPGDRDLEELCALAAGGIHDPATMPFAVPWTDKPPGAFEIGFLQHHWRMRAGLAPHEWHLAFAVRVDGRLAGVQELFAHVFAARRTAETGSWLGRAFQGRGIGREMRGAVLHLAFAGLGADFAVSMALADNAASLAVSRALGYRYEGEGTAAPRGKPVPIQRYRIDRATWLATHRPAVTVEGLDPCLGLLGAAQERAR